MKRKKAEQLLEEKFGKLSWEYSGLVNPVIHDIIPVLAKEFPEWNEYWNNVNHCDYEIGYNYDEDNIKSVIAQYFDDNGIYFNKVHDPFCDWSRLFEEDIETEHIAFLQLLTESLLLLTKLSVMLGRISQVSRFTLAKMVIAILH